jgi:homoserine dehydrogenase
MQRVRTRVDSPRVALERLTPLSPPLLCPSSPTLTAHSRSLRYTEAQPQNDLLGVDVAGKLVLLARELGAQLSLADVHLEPLVPAALLLRAAGVGSGCASGSGGGGDASGARGAGGAGGNADSVLAALRGYDAEFAALLARESAAGGGNRRLRYIATIEMHRGDGSAAPAGAGAWVACAGGCQSVRVSARPTFVGEDHPAHRLRGTDIFAAFVTERFAEGSPLLLQGAGTGGEVAAAGVLQDVLAVAQGLRGR